MDQAAVVSGYEEFGRRLLSALADAGFAVTAAGWVQTDTDSEPYLYIATPRADNGYLRAAYLEIFDLLRGLPRSQFHLPAIKLIATFDPLGQAMSRYMARYADHPVDSTVYTDNFEGVSVQRPVFLYALPVPAPTGG